MDTTELVKKLLAEGAKEFPHQWQETGAQSYAGPLPPSRPYCCPLCGISRDGKGKDECPILLRTALDLTLKERDNLRVKAQDLEEELAGIRAAYIT